MTFQISINGKDIWSYTIEELRDFLRKESKALDRNKQAIIANAIVVKIERGEQQ